MVNEATLMELGRKLFERLKEEWRPVSQDAERLIEMLNRKLRRLVKRHDEDAVLSLISEADPIQKLLLEAILAKIKEEAVARQDEEEVVDDTEDDDISLPENHAGTNGNGTNGNGDVNGRDLSFAGTKKMIVVAIKDLDANNVKAFTAKDICDWLDHRGYTYRTNYVQKAINSNIAGIRVVGSKNRGKGSGRGRSLNVYAIELNAGRVRETSCR